MKSKTQKYQEAVERNIRNMRAVKYRGKDTDTACRMIGVRREDLANRYAVSVALGQL